jgi:PAS domain S-box-containing protein
VAAVFAAFVVKIVLEPVTGRGAPFALFFGAVVLVSLWAGPGPGIVATLVSVPLWGRMYGADASSRAQLAWQAAIFAVDGVVVVYLAHLMTRARLEAERSEARLRDLIELAPDAFFLADLRGRFVDVNQAACRLLGYERAELLHMTVADIIPVPHHPRMASTRAALLVPGGVHRDEWPHRRKDGSIITVEVSAKILSGGRWQAFVRDVSERKRAEREAHFLAEASTRLTSSLDSGRILATTGELVVSELADLCVVDIVEIGDRPRRLLVASADPRRAPLAERLERVRLDRDRPHLTRRVLDTKSSYLIERVTDETLKSFAQSAEHLRILREAEPRSIMGVPLKSRGELLGVLVLISSKPARLYGLEDLRTAEALAERAALAIDHGRLYETAVQATKLRDEVMGVVAHDLRNPMAAILMNAASLRRRGAEPERRSQRARENIERAGGRMNHLISDLLDVSLIEAGKLAIERARVSTRQLLEETVEAQRPLAASKAIDLQLEVAGAPADLWGDEHRLLQVFENLVGNALKFTSQGGRVLIGAAPSQGDILFWVADNGPGIPAHALPHVFERFWQLMKGDRKGAGLGLPVTRGIVEAHGGQIWVESTLGRGSIFFFTIPEAPAEAAQPEALH